MSKIWGFNVVSILLQKGKAWEDTGLFPRITMCDFKVDYYSISMILEDKFYCHLIFKIIQPNNHYLEHSVQCILMANMINEKIFLLLYYIFAFLIFATLVNFFHWLYVLWFPCFGSKLVTDLFYLGNYHSVSIIFNDEFDVQSHGSDLQPTSDSGTESYTNESTIMTAISSPSTFVVGDDYRYHQNDTVRITGGTKRRLQGSSVHTQEVAEVKKEKKRKIAQSQRRMNALFRQNSKKFINYLGMDGILIIKSHFSLS